MPVFTPINVNLSKVHHTEPIRAEDKPEDTETKPAEPAQPTAPKAE